MNDKTFQNQLDDYLNGQLPKARREAFEQAMIENPQWRGEVEMYRRLLDGLSPNPLAPTSPETHARIRQNSLAEFRRQRRHGRRPKKVAAILVTAMALLTILGMAWQKSPPEPAIQMVEGTAKPAIQVMVPTDDPDIAIYWTYDTPATKRSP